MWLRSYEPAVLLVPLVSWATPAHVPEGYLLKPSIRQCRRRLGYDEADSLHWFGVPVGESLCRFCWEASACTKEFGYPPELSETLLGLLPLNTLVARRLIQQSRSWVEPCQSFEKNILGLDQMFLNSLRLTWTMSLLADAVGLLRALALMNSPSKNNLLQELIPTQLAWSWENLGQTEK